MALPVSQGGIDYPDGGFASGGMAYPLVGDLAELASRLGGLNTFNREGNVIYIENFESGAPQWSESGYGAGADMMVSSLRALSPPFSLQLTTGSSEERGIKTTLNLPLFERSVFGLEYAFTHELATSEHIAHFYVHEGTKRYEYFVKLDVSAGELELKVDNGDWDVFASGLNMKTDAWTFHQLKLVVDTVDNEYVRFLYDDTEYDLSAYVPNEEPDTDPPGIEIAIQYKASYAANLVTHIDNVIITRNEPVGR